jgi:uncharacterized protein (DUF433 family)
MSDTTAATEIPVPAITEHIVITPGVCGGRPRITGRRITVQHIVLWHERGALSPDEIASRHSLTLGDVYAALAYYHDHRAEVRAQIEEDERFADEMRSRTPSLVQQRMSQHNAPDDSLPPG